MRLVRREGAGQRYTFTSVANQQGYAFPSDLARWLDCTFFNSTSRFPLRGPLTPSEWEWAQANWLAGGPMTSFRVWNNLFQVYPVPTNNSITYSLEYVSSYPVLDGSTGTPKADYTQDSDKCRFDHRMVVYGIKYKWLASIGQDTSAALGDYRRAVEFQKGQEQPGRTLSLLSGWRYPYLTNANYSDGSWGT